MQKPKKRTSPKKSTPPKKSVDWLQFLDDIDPRLVIPVGSRFQADVPEWRDPSDEAGSSNDSDDTTRLLGPTTWPLEDDNAPMQEGKIIGRGRPDSCTCSSAGSVQCVKRHVSEARRTLQSELGPAFESWKFDEMGEDVGKLWTSKQKSKFTDLVKKNPLSEDKSFLQPAVKAFPSKTRKDIVSYYLNVHVPNRIGKLTRSGCATLDSDDDEAEAASSSSKKSSKRSRSSTHVDITEHVKSHYLVGRR